MHEPLWFTWQDMNVVKLSPPKVQKQQCKAGVLQMCANIWNCCIWLVTWL